MPLIWVVEAPKVLCWVETRRELLRRGRGRYLNEPVLRNEKGLGWSEVRVLLLDKGRPVLRLRLWTGDVGLHELLEL